jgi:hypothetical protein
MISFRRTHDFTANSARMASVTRRILWSERVVHASTPKTAYTDNAMAKRFKIGFFASAQDFGCGLPPFDYAQGQGRKTPQNQWCTGEDSNLRSSQGAADLQSAAINHSATCAETPILRFNYGLR